MDATNFSTVKNTPVPSFIQEDCLYCCEYTLVIGRMPPMRLIPLTLFIFFAGCSVHQGPDVVFISSGQYAKAFDAAIDAASSKGLKPVFVDRRGGIIETNPTVAGSVVEPWKQSASSPRQTIENTLSLQRRTARFEFRPAKVHSELNTKEALLVGPDLLATAGQDLTRYTGQLELRVWVYVDRHYTKGMRRGTWSLSSETVSTVLPTREPWEQSPSRFWVPVSRDVSAERTLLSAIEMQLHGE